MKTKIGNTNACDVGTTIDHITLLHRHAGNYIPTDNGEIYRLPYENVLHQLKSRDKHCFDHLSSFDFLNDDPANLTLKSLIKCLAGFNDETNRSINSYWNNLNDHTLKKYFNALLRTANWRDYLKKNKETDTDKPHHNDVLKCLYLIAHLCKVQPSWLRQLAQCNDAWSTEFRVYYPRDDFNEVKVFGTLIAEAFSAILFHQPPPIKIVIKNLENIADKLIEHSASPVVELLLKQRSTNHDSPSLLMLKHSQIFSIGNKIALNHYLKPLITGHVTPNASLLAQEAGYRGGQLPATVEDYEIVAKLAVRILHREPFLPSQESEEEWHLVRDAFISDANAKVSVQSNRSYSGTKDTSLAAAVKQLASQNSTDTYAIFTAISLDFAGVAEVFSTYLTLRAKYVLFCNYDKARSTKFLSNIDAAKSTFEIVSNYLYNNNLTQICYDLILLEKLDIEELEFFSLNYHDLPAREPS